MLLYGLMALAVLWAIGGFVGYERKAGADAVRAELEPKLTACQGQITALADETAKRQVAASLALAKAEGRVRVWQDNALRLQSVLANRRASPEPPKDCKAAFSDIREAYK